MSTKNVPFYIRNNLSASCSGEVSLKHFRINVNYEVMVVVSLQTYLQAYLIQYPLLVFIDTVTLGKEKRRLIEHFTVPN